MAQFRKAVVTEKGLALILKTQMKNIRLEFSRVVTGSGEYLEDEELNRVTALKSPVQEFEISSVGVIDPKTVKLSAALSNEGLTVPYYMREIGIYATDPDEGEILYSLAVAYPGKADYLPAYDGMMPVNVMLDTYQSVSDAENVTIRADTGAYALAKDLKELKDKTADLEKTVNDGFEELRTEVQDVSKVSVINLDIIIPASGWIVNTDTAVKYALCVNIPSEIITEDLIPSLTILPSGQQAAKECDMCSTVRTIDGALRIYAQEAPAAEIPCSLTLVSIGGGTAGGGGNTGTGSYILPVASADRLGGVKIGEGFSVASDGTISVDGTAVEEKIIPTPEEIQTALDDAYNKSGENQS